MVCIRFVSIPILALALLGCEDPAVNQMRPDSGVAGVDSGTGSPLMLEEGMTFVYRGQLTARVAPGDEKSSIYNLTVTIDAIDDDEATGQTRLTFSAEGENMLNQDWTDPFDQSSWVARLGPALQADQVGTGGLEVDLSEVPSLPTPRGNPKTLPNGNFFIDVRKVADIRTRFAERYRDQMPQVADPSQNNGRWLFAFEGEDPRIITYEVPDRTMRLEYDPQGFLVRIDETLGRVDTPPSASCTLTLTTGP